MVRVVLVRFEDGDKKIADLLAHGPHAVRGGAGVPAADRPDPVLGPAQPHRLDVALLREGCDEREDRDPDRVRRVEERFEDRDEADSVLLELAVDLQGVVRALAGQPGQLVDHHHVDLTRAHSGQEVFESRTHGVGIPTRPTDVFERVNDLPPRLAASTSPAATCASGDASDESGRALDCRAQTATRTVPRCSALATYGK